MWRCFLGDTMSGVLSNEIDVPSFSWSVTVSDATFRTEKDKGVGVNEGGGVTLPWTEVPGSDSASRSAAVMPLKRSLTLFWDTGSGPAVPIIWGAIGERTDTWADTSFDLTSAMSILESRFLVREGAFGSVEGMTEPTGDDEAKPGRFTRDTIFYENMSLRGIASEVGRLCTSAKPAGLLPIDWPYLGEAGSHQRTYDGFDVGNDSCSAIFEKIANVIDGPDIQFRPYMSEGGAVRLRFMAGTDGDLFLGQSSIHSLSWYPGGGSLQDIQVDFSTPVMRVYATGSGTDEAMLCHLSEDLSLCSTFDPWPLVEEHYHDPDVDNGALLEDHGDAELSSLSLPCFQLTGYVDFADPDVPKPGSIWPGEMVQVSIDGFPSLPDGIYRLRLMEMSGDETTRAKLVFRQETSPVY